jgi:predicted amidophosphoribosyltransferase
MTIELKGNWKKGFAFDVHTLDSVYLGVDEHGHDRWANTRSEMGQLVYDLKYGKDQTALEKIVDLLDKMKGIETIDYIVPIPPTNPSRQLQPVSQIARELGKRRGVRVLDGLLLKKRGGPELKNVEDPTERRELLRKSLILSKDYDISGTNVLLVDDLYRSGATLSAATSSFSTKAKRKQFTC